MTPMLLALPFAAALVAQAPVTAVTVYSDRARVTRTARVDLSGQGGPQRLDLPPLLGPIDAATIRVEAQGAEVRSVEIGPIDATQVPPTAARELLDQLEALDEKLQRLASERAVYDGQLGLLRRLVPQVPQGDPLRPAPRLNPTGWTATLSFLRDRTERAQDRLRKIDDDRQRLGEDRQALAERVRLLGAARRGGFQVRPTLLGKGPARVTISYLTSGARWLPTYDIQLDPGKGQVELRFAGQVSQETGEDWLDAELHLSTAVPGTAMQLPKLLTWKIGERERFIPTPQPLSEVPPPPPPPPPPRTTRDEGGPWRQLLSRVGLDGGRMGGEGANDKSQADRDYDGVADRLDEGEGKMGKKEEASKRPAEPRPEPVVVSAPAPARVRLQKARIMTETTASAPGVAMETSIAGGYVAADQEEARMSWATRGPTPPTFAVGLRPPPAWRPPSFSPELPASLAGGYDLTYPSLGRETVKSGRGPRRVPLFAKSIQVRTSHKLFPALSPEAYLVAEIRNVFSDPLPGGKAQLYVGADPAGVATLKLAAPGESFTLPLGLDRAVKGARNVRVTTEEKGIISKDELNVYTVTTEVVNPHPMAITLRVLDQLPLIADKNVEIKLMKSDPPAQPDKYTGALEWPLHLAPGAKGVVTFVYSLRRPKGYRLYQ